MAEIKWGLIVWGTALFTDEFRVCCTDTCALAREGEYNLNHLDRRPLPWIFSTSEVNGSRPSARKPWLWAP